MKISELLAFVDSTKPNAFPSSTKIAWINEVEGMIWCDVMLLSPLEFNEHKYNENTGEGDTELLVEVPHSKLYNVYLAAMIDFYNGEYNKYQNSITLFNSYFSEFSRWYALHYRPADGEFQYMGEYITAYGIAVKHGFTGTEEEWLESLRGNVDTEMVKEFITEYLEENPIDAPVMSVNGQTGNVQLDATDVGARPNTWTPTASDVGARPNTWTPTASDVGARPNTWTPTASEVGARPNTWTPTASEVGAVPASELGNAINTALAEAKLSGEFDGRDGNDGVSPTVSVTNITGGHRIAITDVNGTKAVDVMDGTDGQDGQDGKDGRGITEIKRTSGNGAAGTTDTYTITYTDNTKSTFTVYNGRNGVDGQDGQDGQDGKDGKSPVVSVSKIGKVTTITITDAQGIVHTATINDGADGGGGSGGGGGEDGIGIASIVQTTKSTEDDGINVMTITLTDGSTHTFEVQNGSKGSKGNDGISPMISTSEITGGHKITITDVNGTKTVNVMNGTDGKDGNDGRGIKTIARTNGNGAAGTTDTYTITYTDNTTSTFNVYNGKNGTNGTSVTISNVTNNTGSGATNTVTFSDGKTLSVKNGTNGSNGTNGTSVTVSNVSESTADGGSNVVTFSDGKTVTVKNGSKGSTGANGYTPVKGTDYWTAADKASMVSDVLAALPTWNGGSY